MKSDSRRGPIAIQDGGLDHKIIFKIAAVVLVAFVLYLVSVGLNGYSVRNRRISALSTLDRIYAAEKEFYTMNQKYSEKFSELKLGPNNSSLYVYFLFSGDFMGTDVKLYSNTQMESIKENVPLLFISEKCMAVAYGNADADEDDDVLCLDYDGHVKIVLDDSKILQ